MSSKLLSPLATPPRPAWIALLVSVVWLGGCTGPESPPEYVGSTVCAECHTEEYTRWQGSHHDRAMEIPGDSTVVGDFDNAGLDHWGQVSRFSREGGFAVTTQGPDGRDATFPVAYTFGVEPLQQYLVELPGGVLQTLAVSWDSRSEDDGGQRWFHQFPDEPVPHTDPLHWTRRFFRWNTMCAECHSTGLRRGYDAETNTYDYSWAEIDVACEACHGPGSAHVAAAERGKGAAGLIVDTRETHAWDFPPGEPIAAQAGGRPNRLQVDLCGRCHARRNPLVEEYLPDEPMGETHRVSLIEDRLYHPDGQMMDEVYVYGSFLQSRMYAAGVRCTDCHDPHRPELGVSGNDVCAKCHAPASFDVPDHHFHKPGTEGARCISCHMPTVTYMVVDERHDHSFRVPRPDLSEALGTPDVCTACHQDRDFAWAAGEIRARSGAEALNRPEFATAFAAALVGRPEADSLLLAVAADTAFTPLVRASALVRLRPWTFEAAQMLKAAAAHEDPLLRRGAMEALRNDPGTLRVSLAPQALDDQRSIRFEAARMLYGMSANDVPSVVVPRLAEVMEEFRESQRLFGDRGESQTALGFLHLQEGDPAAAEARFRRALEVDPDFTPAAINLADLLRDDREPEGEAVLRRQLERVGDLADLRLALAFSLVRRQRYAEAELEVAAARRLEPGNAYYAVVHAVALEQMDRGDDALRVLDETLAARPWDRDLAARRNDLARRLGTAN